MNDTPDDDPGVLAGEGMNGAGDNATELPRDAGEVTCGISLSDTV